MISFRYLRSPRELIRMAGSLPFFPQRLMVRGDTLRMSATSRIVKRSGKSSSDTFGFFLLVTDMEPYYRGGHKGCQGQDISVDKPSWLIYSKCMYIGPFYFESKDLFFIFAAILIGVALYFDWSLWSYSPQTLLTLAVVMLITRGLIRSADNDIFFFHSIITLVLAIFFPFFQIMLFYTGGLILFRLFKLL